MVGCFSCFLLTQFVFGWHDFLLVVVWCQDFLMPQAVISDHQPLCLLTQNARKNFTGLSDKPTIYDKPTIPRSAVQILRA